MSYQESEQRIVEADAAARAGDHERARALYREAAELQRAFVEAQPADRVRTKSIFGRSAATLYYEAGDLDEAERFARSLLAEPWIEPGSAVKLRSLLQDIADERAAGAAGVVRQRLRKLGVPRLRPSRRPLFRGVRP